MTWPPYSTRTMQPARMGTPQEIAPMMRPCVAELRFPLELRFGREFEKLKSHLLQEVAVALSERVGGTSGIDTAESEKRFASSVDGVAFHIGVKLKLDRWICENHMKWNLPWTMVEWGGYGWGCSPRHARSVDSILWARMIVIGRGCGGAFRK